MSQGVSAEDVTAYLWHGYLPPRDIPDWFPHIFEGTATDYEYTPQAAAERLDSLFDRLVSTVPATHVVPISGGWDSRLILGALRERVDDIVTVTLGAPGQLDYDVGARVAKAAGVQHYPVSLEHLTLDWSDLVEAARNAPWTYMPDAYFLSYAYKQATDGAASSVVWSGFLGDPLTGGHYKNGSSVTDQTHIAWDFQASQCRMREGRLEERIGPPAYPHAPGWWTDVANAREFLDFCVRQRGCIAPIVLGREWRGWQSGQGHRYPGVDVVAPYADAGWASYWLNAPRKMHRGQWLYREMAKLRFPDLFRLPSKFTWGVNSERRLLQRGIRYTHALRNRLHRRFPSLPVRSRIADNYIDFQWAFRKRDDYIAVIKEAMKSLQQREAVPWVDLDRIWQEHYRGRCDHSQALQVLLGLAVNLEANG